MARLIGIAAGRRLVGVAAILAVAAFWSAAPLDSAAGRDTQSPPALTAGALPVPLVYLRDIDPSVVQDIRYAGRDNFTGAPVPGYDASECILTRSTAEALAAVQRHLAGRGLSLKVYDCYRPVRAVAAFVRWTRSTKGDATSMRFHPALPRNRLVPLGYIASRSAHSRGHAVDVTLVAMPRRETPAFMAGHTYGACIASMETRAPDDSLDMGTGFDCFDVLSHSHAAGISAAQAKNRQTLLDVMTRAGFLPYYREWWHFSFPAGDPGRTFEVDVAAHP
jgi:zinc D-Ala-D-Ala dipeptidase